MSAAPSWTAEASYLVEIAKDWAVSRFASADKSDFILGTHRFELSDTGVRRHRVKPGSPESVSPLDAVAQPSAPTAWSHSTFVTLLVDSGSTTTAVEQEVVEVLAVDRDGVLAVSAAVVRIPGLAPCLGAFGSVE